MNVSGCVLGDYFVNYKFLLPNSLVIARLFINQKLSVMKKFLPLLVFVAFVACTNNQIEKEKDAIIKVLKEETDAFIANDIDRISAIHIQDSTTTRMSFGGREVSIHKGWEEVKGLFEDSFRMNSSDSSWQNPKNYKENIMVRVSGNSAWLVCDNTWEYEYKKKERKFTNVQVAFFEKVNGNWKFSYDSYIPKPTVNKNKELSDLYHKRNLEDVDLLLDDNFVGSFYNPNEPEIKLWYKEGHKKSIARNPDVKDSVINQVVEGNWVAERFIRSFESDGKVNKAEMMQFKQFRNGKIIKSYELYNPLQ